MINPSSLLKTTLGVFVLCCLFFTDKPQAGEPAPIIAVASNLRYAVEQIGQSFNDDTGLKVRFSFGSSGNLARQILQGAPFQMFMSADENFVFRLADAGHSIDAGRIYAYGRIVAFTPHRSPLQGVRFPDEYLSAFDRKDLQRYAIANPDLAPYGRAAREALGHAGLWKKIQSRLIFGENISQTAQFTLSGSAMGGIIAYSQVLTPRFAKGGSFQMIPTETHRPLGQRMVLLKSAGDVTRRFFDYVGQKAASKILQDNGYALNQAGG